MFTIHVYSIYMNKQDLALNNLQWLIWHKTQPSENDLIENLFFSFKLSRFSLPPSRSFFFFFLLLLSLSHSFALSLSLSLKKIYLKITTSLSVSLSLSLSLSRYFMENYFLSAKIFKKSFSFSKKKLLENLF